MDLLQDALERHYGWSDFRPGQRPVVECLLHGQDCLAVLPTGGGKSLCYQLPALVRSGLVVVISPLVALMEDQVLQLRRRGIAAACVHGGIDPVQRRETLTQLSEGSLRLLYLAPERLQGDATRSLLQEHAAAGQLVALAVDEAHCISAWGHDFRPDYRRLGELRALCPGVPMVALSATAAPRVRADILRLLHLRRPLIQVGSARRHNLHYAMRRRVGDPLQDVVDALDNARGACLIYARTRISVERWTERLCANGVHAIAYHAGLEPEVRHRALEHFLEAEDPVLVATVAFGMGVDRADVGLVLHLDLPSTPEGYLQESGRAGRDGKPAQCLVLFSPRDRTRLGWAMQSALRRTSSVNAAEEARRIELAQQQLRRMEAVAEGETCREQALLLSVGELVPPCGRCDRCQSSASRQDWSEEATAVLELLAEVRGVDARSLSERLNSAEGRSAHWGWLTRRLVQEELIHETDDGSQRLFLKESGRRFLRQPWPLHYAA